MIRLLVPALVLLAGCAAAPGPRTPEWTSCGEELVGGGAAPLDTGVTGGQRPDVHLQLRVLDVAAGPLERPRVVAPRPSALLLGLDYHVEEVHSPSSYLLVGQPLRLFVGERQGSTFDGLPSGERWTGYAFEVDLLPDGTLDLEFRWREVDPRATGAEVLVGYDRARVSLTGVVPVARGRTRSFVVEVPSRLLRLEEGRLVEEPRVALVLAELTQVGARRRS